MGLSSGARPDPEASRSPGFAVREAAAALLSAVIARGTTLEAAMDGDEIFAALDVRDRALCRAIVGTALRRHGTIEDILHRLIAKPPRHAGNLFAILEIAAAQLLFMRTADHAAVSVAVDQVAADRDARHFKSLANAVLRRIGRERDTLIAGVPASADAPAWLAKRWRSTYGEVTADAIMRAHRDEPALDLSVTSDPAVWAEKLGGVVLPTGSVRLVASGPIEALPGYAEGAWWVQDAAAALPARLLGNVRGLRVADLCAAPGGKTAALANGGAHVVAIDISPARLARVRENLGRLHLSAEVVAADVLTWEPAELPNARKQGGAFDAILLDAPCTATGTIRRHPDVAWLKRPGDVAALAALQRRMLARASGWLRPGGTLVFCTCSLEPEEGETHVAAALATLPLDVVPVTPDEVGGLAELLRPDGTVRTLPSQLHRDAPRLSGLDGFFIARFRRRPM